MIRYMIGSNAVTKAALKSRTKQFGLLGQQLSILIGENHIWNNKKKQLMK
jgi:hypothetical protein